MFIQRHAKGKSMHGFPKAYSMLFVSLIEDFNRKDTRLKSSIRDTKSSFAYFFCPFEANLLGILRDTNKRYEQYAPFLSFPAHRKQSWYPFFFCLVSLLRKNNNKHALCACMYAYPVKVRNLYLSNQRFACSGWPFLCAACIPCCAYSWRSLIFDFKRRLCKTCILCCPHGENLLGLFKGYNKPVSYAFKIFLVFLRDTTQAY